MGGLRRLQVATQVKSTVIGTATFPRIGPVNRVAKRPASARRAGSEPSRGNTSVALFAIPHTFPQHMCVGLSNSAFDGCTDLVDLCL